MNNKSKDIKEIELSILEYLHRKEYNESYKLFREESGINIDFPMSGQSDMLVKDPRLEKFIEKKWQVAAALQKRLIESENKLKDVEKGKNQNINKDCLPKGPPKFILNAHRMNVNKVIFHPVYKILFTCSDDFTIMVWDYEQGTHERTLKGHTKAVHDIAVSGDKGALLASCSSDLSIKIWDINNDYQCIKTFNGHDHTVSTICFNSSGDILLSGSRDKTIKVWDIERGHCIETIKGHQDWVRTVNFSSDNQLILSGSTDHTVRTWTFPKGESKTLFHGHQHVVEHAIFAPQSSYPYIKELCNLSEPQDRPGLYIFSASRDKTIILSNEQGQKLHQFRGHDSWVRKLVVTEGGKYLISCGDDKVTRIFDIQTGRLLRSLIGHDNFVSAIDLSKSGNLMASSSHDLSVRIWKCE